MLLVKERSSDTNLELPSGYFQLVRDRDGFAMIIRQPAQMQINRYRFRHHGRRKYLYLQEPVSGSENGRSLLSREAAIRVFRAALKSGRAEVLTEQGDGRWTLSVKAANRVDVE